MKLTHAFRLRIAAALALSTFVLVLAQPARGGEASPLVEELLAQGDQAESWYRSLSPYDQETLAAELESIVEGVVASDEPPSPLEEAVYWLAVTPTSTESTDCTTEVCAETGGGAFAYNQGTGTDVDSENPPLLSPTASDASTSSSGYVSREFQVRGRNMWGATLYRYAIWLFFYWNDVGIIDTSLSGYPIESNWGINFEGVVTSTVTPPDNGVPVATKKFVNVGHFEACITWACKSYYPRFKGKMIAGGTVTGTKQP